MKENLRSEIKMYLESDDNKEVTAPILWDALKVVIRGKIIAISWYEKRMRQQKLRALEKELKRFQIEHVKSPQKDSKGMIIKFKKEIDEINTEEIKKKLTFTKQQYYEVGEKSLKLLSFKLRKQQADRTIHKIRNSATKEIESCQ